MGWSDYGYPEIDRNSFWKCLAGIYMAINERYYGFKIDRWLPERFSPLYTGNLDINQDIRLGSWFFNEIERLENQIHNLFSSNNKRINFIKSWQDNLFIDEGDAISLNPDVIITWKNLPELLGEDIITLDAVKNHSQVVPYFQQRYHIMNLLNRIAVKTPYENRVYIADECGRGNVGSRYETAEAAWNAAIEDFRATSTYRFFEGGAIGQDDRTGLYNAILYRTGFYCSPYELNSAPFKTLPSSSHTCEMWFRAYADSNAQFASLQYINGINSKNIDTPYYIENENGVTLWNYHFFGGLPSQPPADGELRQCRPSGDVFFIYYPDFEFKAQEETNQ